MSHFYGYLTGHRGTATRCGSKKSGIQARIKSWTHDVTVHLYADDAGNDVLNLSIPDGLKVQINGKIYKTKGAK